MQKKILYLLLLFLSNVLQAQRYNANWINIIECDSGITVTGVCKDDSGGVYVGGYYKGFFIADSIYTSNGKNDAFVIKYKPQSDTIQWVKTFGGPKENWLKGAFYNNSVYLFLNFEDTFSFSGDTFQNYGYTDMCLLSLNANSGALNWKKVLGGKFAEGNVGDKCFSISKNKLYSLGVSGATLITDTCFFDTLYTVAKRGNYNLVFDTSGHVSNINIVGKVSAEDIDVNTKNNNFFSLGIGQYFPAPVYDSCVAICQPNVGAFSNNVFVSKHKPNGVTEWARGISGISCSSSGCAGTFSKHYCAADTFGNVYVAGLAYGHDVLFHDNTKFNTIIGSDFNYIVKYDGNGNKKWAKLINASYLGIEEISTDHAGNVYVLGNTAGWIKFGPDSIYGAGLMVLQYDSLGNEQWAITTKNVMSCYSTATAISVYDVNKFILGGAFANFCLLDTLNMSAFNTVRGGFVADLQVDPTWVDTTISGTDILFNYYTANEIKIYPNPITKTIYLKNELQKEIQEISIVNNEGSVVYSKLCKSSASILSINIESLNINPGVYDLNIHLKEKTVHKKITIQ